MNPELEEFLETLVDEGYFTNEQYVTLTSDETGFSLGEVVSGDYYERRIHTKRWLRGKLKDLIGDAGIDSVAGAVGWLESRGVPTHTVAAMLDQREAYDQGINQLVDTGVYTQETVDTYRPFHPMDGYEALDATLEFIDDAGNVIFSTTGNVQGINQATVRPVVTLADPDVAALQDAMTRFDVEWTADGIEVVIHMGADSAVNAEGEPIDGLGEHSVKTRALVFNASLDAETRRDAMTQAGYTLEGPEEYQQFLDAVDRQTKAAGEDNYLWDLTGQAPAYLGLPQGATAVRVGVDDEGQRLRPGDDGTVTGFEFIDALWKPGDPELFFAGWPKESLMFFQTLMEENGLLRQGEYTPGEWDQATEAQIELAMSHANQNALTSTVGAQLPIDLGGDYSAVAGLIDAIGELGQTAPHVPEFTPPPMRIPDDASLLQVIENEYLARAGRRPLPEEISGWIGFLERNYRLSGRDLQLEAERQHIQTYVEQGFMPTAHQQAVVDQAQSEIRDVDPVARFQQAFTTGEATLENLQREREGLGTLRDSLFGSIFAGGGR